MHVCVCVCVLGRTELGDGGVFLVERLEVGSKKEHRELKAVCYLRPTRENIDLLKKELRAPRFKSYYIHLMRFKIGTLDRQPT